MTKKLLIPIGITTLLVVTGVAYTAFKATAPHKASPSAPAAVSTSQQRPTQPVSTFDKTRYSYTASDSLWVIANKNHPLTKGYAPATLVVPRVPLRLDAAAEQMHISSVAAPALEQLVAAAAKDGIALKLSSGYRSEALQKQFYDSYVAKDGVAAADRYSARPGTSEHQTGLSADMIPANDKCHLEVCFADLPEGKWLATHAHEHGFIIRYLKDKESFTTYQYEPWHIRYVGNDLAAELYRTGQTMEEFFNYL